MSILSNILFWLFLACVGFILLLFIVTFSMSLVTGFASWISYRRSLKNNTTKECPPTDYEKILDCNDKTKRGFFGLIKDSLTIALWAFLFSLIAVVSIIMTICLCLCEGIESLYNKITGRKSDNYW